MCSILCPACNSPFNELASSIFDGLSSIQRDFVAGWVYHHAQRPTTTDPHWGEHHAKDDTKILLQSLVDYLEIDPEIQDMQAALSGWLTDGRRAPDEQRESAAQRILNFIADPLRIRPHGGHGNDHILDLSGLNLSDVSVLQCYQVGSRADVLVLAHNRLTDLPRFYPYFSHLCRLDVQHNMLTSLNFESLTSLPHLTFMTVGHNRFSRATSIDLQTRMAELHCFGLFDNQDLAPAPQSSVPQPHRFAASMPRAPQRPAGAPLPSSSPRNRDEAARRWIEERAAEPSPGLVGWYRGMPQATGPVPAPAPRAPQPSAPANIDPIMEEINQLWREAFEERPPEWAGDFFSPLPRTAAIPASAPRAPQPSAPELSRYAPIRRPERPAPAASAAIPGTIPYDQHNIPQAVKDKAAQIKEWEKEYDEWKAKYYRSQVTEKPEELPDNFVCGLMGVGCIMSIPVFHPHDVRHIFDQESLEGHFQAHLPSETVRFPAPAKCPTCRYPENGGIDRAQLKINTKLQDEIYAFLKRVLKK